MVQKYFTDSWLLRCSLRSHRTANPTPTQQAGGVIRMYLYENFSSFLRIKQEKAVPLQTNINYNKK